MKTLRKLDYATEPVQSLRQAALMPEVEHALTRWLSYHMPQGFARRPLLIGGLAMSFYARPRVTLNVDLLFQTVSDLPSEVAGFTRDRTHVFIDPTTNVEVCARIPSMINLPQSVASRVFASARPISVQAFKERKAADRAKNRAHTTTRAVSALFSCSDTAEERKRVLTAMLNNTDCLPDAVNAVERVIKGGQ